MIQDTSLEAYDNIQPTLGNRQRQILKVLEQFPQGRSNLSISRILGVPINSVTPRIKELRDLGIVIFSHYERDRVTNRNCMCWKVKE